MNERIIRLGLHSGMLNYIDHETPRVYFLHSNADEDCLVEFAELIARECADVCDRFQARGVGMQPAECAGAIRKMFGVKPRTE